MKKYILFSLLAVACIVANVAFGMERKDPKKNNLASLIENVSDLFKKKSRLELLEIAAMKEENPERKVELATKYMKEACNIETTPTTRSFGAFYLCAISATEESRDAMGVYASGEQLKDIYVRLVSLIYVDIVDEGFFWKIVAKKASEQPEAAPSADEIAYVIGLFQKNKSSIMAKLYNNKSVKEICEKHNFPVREN